MLRRVCSLGWNKRTEGSFMQICAHRGPSGLLIPTGRPSFCSQVGPIEATSFTLRAVRPRARYCIQVAAQDLTDYGESSNWSLPATASVTLGK